MNSLHIPYTNGLGITCPNPIKRLAFAVSKTIKNAERSEGCFLEKANDSHSNGTKCGARKERLGSRASRVARAGSCSVLSIRTGLRAGGACVGGKGVGRGEGSGCGSVDVRKRLLDFSGGGLHGVRKGCDLLRGDRLEDVDAGLCGCDDAALRGLECALVLIKSRTPGCHIPGQRWRRRRRPS